MISPADAYRDWILNTGRLLREGDPPPVSASGARRRAGEIRERMRRSFGLWPEEKPSLNPTVRGVLERDGYRIDLVTFQTRPGCLATASVYVPAQRGKFPAVLCVHGHWAGARRDPVVQSRCIGLAKLGFVALTLDAWGAGERGTRPGVNEYHGSLLGASLWPGGTPLNGMQVYDNVRALDYLQSREDVLPDRIGCTGASGGGNQTTTMGAFDPRIRCSVPVCSVGRYLDYLKTACCVDEVLRDALTYAEEGDLLGMVAPGAVMVITATRDTYHFGPESAAAAVERARHWFRAQDVEERVRHLLIESGHNYHQPMREAMYGWMTRWLKGEGDGSPIPEPSIRTEEPDALRCFAPEKRPRQVMTTVDWVADRTRGLVSRIRVPGDREACGLWSLRRRESLAALLRFPGALPAATIEPSPPPSPPGRDELLTEPGIRVPTRSLAAGRPGSPLVVVLHPGGMEAGLASPVVEPLAGSGAEIRALELRGCGELVLPGQALGTANPDHNLVEWGLWIGRPLLGQWVHDIRRLLDGRGVSRLQRRVVLVGWREAGVAALLSAALERSVAGVAAIELPMSFHTLSPPHNVRTALFQPDLLVEVGDLCHVAALAAPRALFVAHPIKLDGGAATEQEAAEAFRWTRDFYARIGESGGFVVDTKITSPGIGGMIRGWLAT